MHIESQFHWFCKHKKVVGGPLNIKTKKGRRMSTPPDNDLISFKLAEYFILKLLITEDTRGRGIHFGNLIPAFIKKVPGATDVDIIVNEGLRHLTSGGYVHRFGRGPALGPVVTLNSPTDKGRQALIRIEEVLTDLAKGDQSGKPE